MNIGGVERSFLTLSNQLLEKGNNVSIITLNQSKNLLNYDNKIEIISLKTSRSLLSLFKLLQDTVIRDKENSKNIFFINYFFGRILI